MLKVMLAVCLVATSVARASEASSYDHFRLPTSIRPENYAVKVKTFINDEENGFKFSGLSTITFKVYEDTINITLHSRNLTIDSSKISVRSVNDEANKKKQYAVKGTDVIPKHDYYVIFLEEKLIKNEKYKIDIPFEAELNKNLNGYYRSSYVDKATNETHWLAVTQFEPTSARMAFPCFDEPEMKAKFEIILGHDKKYQAISNMPLKSSKDMKDHADWVWDHFEESVPMSTYLVAYTINDFGYTESSTKMRGDVLFKTWARKDALSQAEYAREAGPKVLKFYEEYFDTKFPLPKIDQIAVPDFSAGAMENWGLVTYRETALLYAQNISSSSNKHRVAEVISHELAHQWFGNLVTMKWWTDLWLNEGFATYVASLGVAYLHPEWDSLKEESVDNTLNIFKVDALKTSHPVSVPIGHAAEIAQIFDAISYGKGSCVIRMMHLFLGEETFRRGITNYLKKHAYGNAEQDYLWDAITEVAHKLKTIPEEFTIKQIMDSWTLQTGYPVVTIMRDYTNGGATIAQSRYLLDTYAARDGNENCWWIPLSYTKESEANFNHTQPQKWLRCSNKEFEHISVDHLAAPDEWIIFNIQLSGLYKVKYDDKNWDLLIDALMGPNFEKIHVINRAQLIDDALDLAWTGDQDYNVAMRLIEYLRQEREYIPWKAALTNLASVNKMLRMTSEYEFFKKYMKKILSPIYETLGGLNPLNSPTENLHAVKHKVLVASWSCRFDVGDCVHKAQEYFDAWVKTENPDETNPIPLDLRSVVYCTAVRHGDEKEWNFLWERYTKSNVASERQTILTSLGCTREIWLLQRYLNWCFDETYGVRKQDSFMVFSSIAKGDVGFHLARDYFIENIEPIYKYYSPETSKLARLIKPLASQMNTEKDYKLMKDFTDAHKTYFEKAMQGVQRALETIEVNSQWTARNYNGFSKHLQKFLVT